MNQIRVGDQIPDFKVLDAAGNDVLAQDLYGCPTVIHFGNDPSIEIDVFNAIFPDIYDSTEGLVISISTMDYPSLEKIIDENRISYVLLSDSRLEMSRAFGVIVDGIIEPTTLIADPEGTVVWLQRKVVLEGHGEVVLRAFNQLFYLGETSQVQ